MQRVQADYAADYVIPDRPTIGKTPAGRAIFRIRATLRLDAAAIAFMLQHGQAKVLLTDAEFAPVIAKALEGLAHKPLVVDVVDSSAEGGWHLGALTYEELLAEGDPEFSWSLPQDEWQAIALNFTSGTTGDPKGESPSPRGLPQRAGQCLRVSV